MRAIQLAQHVVELVFLNAFDYLRDFIVDFELCVFLDIVHQLNVLVQIQRQLVEAQQTTQIIHRLVLALLLCIAQSVH